jgi:hypothetical protein
MYSQGIDSGRSIGIVKSHMQLSDLPALAWLIVGLIGLIIAIAWIVLPFMLISRLNRIIAQLAQIDSQLTIANHQRERGGAQGLPKAVE